MRGRRSPCPVACTLDLIGDTWTLLIIRDLACGKTQYGEFLQSPEKISTNILADRLRRLRSAGIIDSPRNHEGYRLTAKGTTLVPIVQSLADWGLAHIRGTEARIKPQRV